MASDEDILLSTLAEREMARRSFAAYLPYVHGPAWRQTKMAAFLAEQVQTFIETPTGHAADVLVVQTPPQHGKSITLSETLPAWVLGRHPTWRVIEVSYNDESAQRFCRRNADKIRQHGAVLFGAEAGIGQVDRSTEVELANNVGKLISRGVMSGITGNPANLILIDDPIKNRAEADSETFRSRLWSEWVSSIKTRLAAGGKVIIIGFDCNRWALREVLAGNWNYDGQCSPFQAQVISDMIKKVEAGEALETKLVISEETYFEAGVITEEDIATYGLGE